MTVYLLHFDKPISEAHTTQHYLGFAEELGPRLNAHRFGRGARLTQVAQDVLTKLEGAITHLEKIGASPSLASQPGAPASADNGGGPVCQYHGPMKRSKKFDGWHCPSKMGNGEYCKEQVKD